MEHGLTKLVEPRTLVDSRVHEVDSKGQRAEGRGRGFSFLFQWVDRPLSEPSAVPPQGLYVGVDSAKSVWISHCS